MYLESQNFIVRELKPDDKDNLRSLEESRPWAKEIIELKKSILYEDKFDYFEMLWSDYVQTEYFWCIYKKDGQFCGDIQLDKESETEGYFYIQLMDNVSIDGFGRELFKQLINEVVKESRVKHLEFELWNEKDKSKIVFEEAGYDIEDGHWEYDC